MWKQLNSVRHGSVRVTKWEHKRDRTVIPRSSIQLDLPQTNKVSACSRSFMMGEGKGRILYILEGKDAYSLGVAFSIAAFSDLKLALDRWSRHLLLYILSISLNEKVGSHSNPIWKRAYDYAGEWLFQTLKAIVFERFQKSTIPTYLVREMEGMVQGYNDNCGLLTTKISLADLVFVNYGLDMVFGMVYQGRVSELVKRMIKRAPKILQKTLTHLFKGGFRTPDMCCAFGVWGSATRSGKDSFYMRNYQLHNGRYFNELLCFMARVTPSSTGLFLCTPGMLGGLTCLTSEGLTCGVNTVRSAAGSQGFNEGAITVLRSLWEGGVNSLSGVRAFLSSRRFSTAWIFSGQMVDGGEGWETFPVTTSVKPEVPPRFVSLVSKKFPLEESKDSYVAVTKFVTTGFEDWNARLLQDRLPIAEYWSSFQGPLFESWEMEEALSPQVGNMFFPHLPQELPQESFMVCNTFTHPVARLTSMNQSCNGAVFASSSEYRATKLCNALQKGPFDMEGCKELIELFEYGSENGSFSQLREIFSLLNHNHREGFEMSGMLNIVDLRRRRVYLKSGYLGSEWITLSLGTIEKMIKS